MPHCDRCGDHSPGLFCNGPVRFGQRLQYHAAARPGLGSGLHESQTRVVTVVGCGSTTGIAGLINGVCDIARATRAMKGSELAMARGVVPFDLPAMREGLAIVAVGGGSPSGTYRFFQGSVLGGGSTYRTDMQTSPSHNSVGPVVFQDEGGIGKRPLSRSCSSTYAAGRPEPSKSSLTGSEVRQAKLLFRWSAAIRSTRRDLIMGRRFRIAPWLGKATRVLSDDLCTVLDSWRSSDERRQA